ncbi:hypothetical protein Lokhon_00607 [Limimaricola hongkongensis DSM 17492]|uniref:Uncharacterized protein n=1 Tax=Limimaricola hongkongensis DSM 17492 TaxID=1122180 RepID=A0A017HF34_9RHOB|nr:hypothetical protein Lokhon_00607 [Limimaricola hongkongensis DSM 17492]
MILHESTGGPKLAAGRTGPVTCGRPTWPTNVSCISTTATG